MPLKSEKMIIGYSSRVIRKDLILGSLFLILGTYFVAEEPDNIFKYGFLLVSLLHLISGFYQLKMSYLKFENGNITRGGLISKSISVSEVEKIRKFAGDYTLFSSENKLKINSELINKSQLKELDELMQSLEIPLDETPPKKFKYT